jgi:hypothetical protein
MFGYRFLRMAALESRCSNRDGTVAILVNGAGGVGNGGKTPTLGIHEHRGIRI